MDNKKYCVYAKLNPEYILYIGYVFGGYGVFVTNENHTTNYLVYGHYRKIGLAENRLLKSAKSYLSNPVEYKYMTKDDLIKHTVWENSVALNKREICRFIEKLEGSFNTDLKLWTVKKNKLELLKNYLVNNNIEYKINSAKEFIRITVGDNCIYVKVIKPYRKKKTSTYTVDYCDKYAKQTLTGIKDYRTLKYLIKNMKDIVYLKIYSDDTEVCKKLWV